MVYDVVPICSLALNTALFRVLVGPFSFVVASDMRIGGGLRRVLRFLHHIQMASHDLVVIWQKVDKKSKLQILIH